MKIIAQNKKAYFNYHILETYEVGIVLSGTEVKSLREGNISLKESFAKIEKGEVFLYNMHISPYEKGGRYNLSPTRKRKLLLKKREIKSLYSKTNEYGFTLIPVEIYFTRGIAKLKLALAKGKKIYDKRETIKEKEIKRKLERVLKKRK